MFSATCVYNRQSLGYVKLCKDTQEEEEAESRRRARQRRPTRQTRTTKTTPWESCNLTLRERAEILLTRLRECAIFSISERHLEHDHGGDHDVDGDVDAFPNKLDHADDDNDGCDCAGAHDVGDSHDGHDDRPW